MEDFMEKTREELREYENHLQNDIDEFNSKLNLTRNDLFNYIDQQIEYLNRKRNEFNDQFNYLERENKKTCQDNQLAFNKLCLVINQNDQNPNIVSKYFEDFKRKFPMRPRMFKSIPQYHFKNIEIDDLIQKQNLSKSPIVNHHSSSPVTSKSSSDEHNELSNHSFTPIDDIRISPLPTTSMGSSYRKQLASQ
jgi:hypothetical protein